MTYKQLTTIEADVELLDHAKTDADTAMKINRVVGHCRRLLTAYKTLEQESRRVGSSSTVTVLLERVAALEEWRQKAEHQLSGHYIDD